LIVVLWRRLLRRAGRIVQVVAGFPFFSLVSDWEGWPWRYGLDGGEGSLLKQSIECNLARSAAADWSTTLSCLPFCLLLGLLLAFAMLLPLTVVGVGSDGSPSAQQQQSSCVIAHRKGGSAGEASRY
jgi:hypothetical protein